MKHCHFSILYNELPFLKQKMPFLYEHFDQLIFFDLSIEHLVPSNDGSHEYLKSYPDPSDKITVIEKTDLSDVVNYKGHSFVEKRKMFAVGSTFVKDDMDVFWCTDMDEFFTVELIHKVEKLFISSNYDSILVPHIVFFRNEKFVFAEDTENGDMWMLPWARIARHRPGQIYGHCNLNEEYVPVGEITDELIFHFSYVGIQKVAGKVTAYGYPDWVDSIWKQFSESNLKFEGPHQLHGYPLMHPAASRGIKRNIRSFPRYINLKEMIGDIK